MRSVFVKFGTTILHHMNPDKARAVNVAVMRIPEMPGQKIEFEKWELIARRNNLRQFEYNYGMEDEVLTLWPDNGLDRMGQHD